MNELAIKNFDTLELNELENIDGGIDWNFVGGTIAAGGGSLIGAKIGAGIGSIGGPAGSLIGGAAGAIIYSLWD